MIKTPHLRQAHACALALIASTLSVFGEKPAEVSPAFHVDTKAGEILDQYCFSCHEDGTTKGDVRLDNLDTLPQSERLDLMNRMLEQVYLKQMPPKKKTQPSDEEREQLVSWLSGDLHAHNASKLENKLRLPAYGNYVDHEKLFSGKITDAPYTPARRWLVSPQIFRYKVHELLSGDSPKQVRPINYYGVSNPFIMPDVSGVLYYDNDKLNGGIFLAMLNNVDWMSSKQLEAACIKNGEIDPKAPRHYADGWRPKDTRPAFEAIVLSKTPATDAQIAEAIKTQFAAALHRPPTRDEQDKYLKLTRDAIDTAGNTEGLKQMLMAVLLQSEFLYRMEFGAGEADSFGRKMLSPREGAFAISYALGDRSPDAKLLQAAENGQLSTREDYQREVLRLLDDKTYYEDEIDPSLIGRSDPPHLASQPRIIRFFREFFGYPKAVKVFKDGERSGYYYQSSNSIHRGSPGIYVREADMLVKHILNKDQHVFETLLGSEEYFVSPIEDSAKKMEVLEKMYDHFKDTDWKKNAPQVVKDHLEFIKNLHPTYTRAFVQHEHFTAAMIHIEKFREKNLRPNPQWQYAFGKNLMLEAKGYNFEPFDWDYTEATQQPFKVKNRMGILTHPAWLIAHSLNAETDPVRRGRWIREKLLAGRVPDVPITVDAVIPEDHHKSLRERLDKVTNAKECWKCHQYMNPLGLPFESYDDFGRFRTEAPLEHPENIIKTINPGTKYPIHFYKTLPVDSSGVLDSTGDPALDGPVKDAPDLITRLVKSPRVRQSFIRHAFRYFMGRNEMLSDSKTLIDADNAYVQSGGSFRAVVVSLLTSDSFLYRK